MIFPKEAEPADPWIETPEAKQWAREILQAEPPYKLHTPERNRVLKDIRIDRDLIEQICIQSFWSTDNTHEEDDATLIHRIRALRTRINQNSALIAPWRLLPTELQSLIFECMRDASEISHSPIGHVVSQVCRRWREIAHLTPKCWSDIHISEAGVAPHLLERWLERSKTLPLRVHFVESNQRQLTKIRPLLKHAGRIESLVFASRARFTSHLLGVEFEEIDLAPAPILPKLLESATRLTHLALPFGLFRGSRFRALQVQLPVLETVIGLESWEIRTLKPSESIKTMVIQDPESKNEYMSLLRQVLRVAPELEILDLTSWSVVINDSIATSSIPTLSFLKKVFLPRHPKITVCLERQGQFFPNLKVVSLFTAELNGSVSIPAMPTVVALQFRTCKSVKPSEPNPYLPWIQRCQNLRILILEATMWIHKGIMPTLMQDLYNNNYVTDFSWDYLDQARLYAWQHPWCICIAKKNELRLYEHVLADVRPTIWIEEHEFPYSISLRWLEFEKKIKVVAWHVKDDCDMDDSEIW